MTTKVKNKDFNKNLKTLEKKKKAQSSYNKKKNKYPIKPKNRRGQKHSRKYRKIKIALSYITAILIVVSIGVIFSVETLFKIKNIEIIGSTKYSNEEIIDASGITKDLNIFMCDIDFNDELIESKLPYIKKAELKKKIPSTIEIIVEPAVPACALESKGKYVILDKDSKVLEISDNFPDLPVLLGIELDSFELAETAVYKNEQLLGFVEEIFTAFKENGLFNVTYVDFTDLINVCVSYEGRINIKLGKPIDLKYKIDSVGRLFNNESITAYDKGELDASLVKENNKIYFKPSGNV